ALLAGNNDLDGGLALYRDRTPGNEPTAKVQRINYDTALNGRLTVFGLGGNDAFFVDDNSATTTLDGGGGYDLFQIGQIFGNKRDSFNTEGALLPQDTFPALVATTRGWLSPGTHLPLYATGGTGNDEFVVYSNQAELRLDGDDDNDLFVIRAFALAAVCDKSTDGDTDCDWDDVNIVANEATGEFPRDFDMNGVCTTTENPWMTGGDRKNNNLDKVCNNADAEVTRDDDLHTKWEDDVIPLNPVTGAASPKIGLGFSVARPLDIRAGGGEDEVQYNVNAPVSVDGGTGFDKLVVLATEFADDIAVTSQGVFGAGLNVRYDHVEVVEVDGLEGDDEFFIQSTAYGVAYRMIGGLGSDTINVTGDVTEDIVTRELEGLSGTIDHRTTSADPLYNGLPSDGIDYNLATPDTGVVVIEETAAGTTIREGGSLAVPKIDSYAVYLAADPTVPVYVTVSGARAPQQEADDAFDNPVPLPDGNADTLWLCLGDGTPLECTVRSQFQRHKTVNGGIVDEAGRAVVLTFTNTTWDYAHRQFVYLFAEDDPRSEGDRVVVTQHSVISTNPTFDRARVRNVEVMIRDNDTPGVMVTEVEPGTTTEDKRTIVVEGFDDPAVGMAYTGTDDEFLVQLAKEPEGTDTIVVRLDLDAASQQAITLTPSLRLIRHVVGDSTFYTIDFTSANWETPVVVHIAARDDARREDPQTAVINFSRDLTTTDVSGDYVFPNLRSGPGRSPVTVIDNETAALIALESGVGTLVIKCGNTLCTVPGLPLDDYTIRLTKRPTAPVTSAILTDGLADVQSVNGVPVTLQPIGGYTPSRLFLGNLALANVAGKGTLTRTNGSEMGSFL